MNNNHNVTAAIDLLFNPASLQAAIEIEDETNCAVTAGLEWGLAVPAFLNNPALLGRLTKLPENNAISALQEILKQDELFAVTELIYNRDLLKSLLSILLLDSDWEEIAVAAANSVKEQVIYQVGVNQISA